MRSPLVYFFAGVSEVPDMFKFRFKTDAGGELFQKRKVGAGFKGSPGLVATPFPSDDPLDYSNDYSWTLVKGVAVGVLKGARPELFANKVTRPGYWTELGDGHKWLIPVAMLDAPNFSLPKFNTMDESGNWTWQVVDKYAHLTEIAAMLWDKDGDKNGMDETALRNCCIEIIGVNYNLIDVDVAALGLLTQDAYVNIVASVIDKPGLAELARDASLRKARRSLWRDGLLKNYNPTFADATAESGTEGPPNA